MIWNDHFRDVPEGAHALLGASQYTWIRYSSPEQLKARMISHYAQQVGTVLHNFAKDRIKYRIKVSKTDIKELKLELLRNYIPVFVVDSEIERIFPTFQMYVNDAIGFRMRPEQPLFYSENCFGTADAISFDEKKKVLRVHDLKTGVGPVKLDQLLIYASLFCLEYNIKPGDLIFELRIYQALVTKDDDPQPGVPYVNVITGNPTAEDVLPIMNLIIENDKYIDRLKEDTYE